MAECKFCDEDFSSKSEKLEHELEEHENEMSSHDRSEKKSELNKLQQKKKTTRQRRIKQLQYGAIGILLVGIVAGGGYWASQQIQPSGVEKSNSSIGVGEPIHWHAPYRITVCGEEKVLRGGPKLAHTHGQTKFHLEGVRRKKEQATLEWIVDQLGGQLEKDSIMGKENCNGEPANLTVKANGRKLEDPLDYVVRDGDFIRIDYS